MAAYQTNICNLSEVKGRNFFIKAVWYYWNITNNNDKLRDLVIGFFCLIADDGISLIKLAESIKQILCSFWNAVFILSSCVFDKDLFVVHMVHIPQGTPSIFKFEKSLSCSFLLPTNHIVTRQVISESI